MSIAQQLRDGLPRTNQGLADIEQYDGQVFPEDFEITELLGDIIMAEMSDCSDDGKFVERDGIYIDNDMSRNTWRVAKIIMHGAGCSEIIEKGKYIMFPNDKGIRCIQKGEKPRIFLNEERIFGVCAPKKASK